MANFTHSPHPLLLQSALPQQRSVCNLSFLSNQFMFRFHQWNFSTHTFVFPQLQAQRWWIHSLVPKSTSPGSSPRLGPSQSLSPDQEELCRLSVPWKWWRGYILSLKPQEIMNAKKKSVSICYVPPLCSFIHQHISEEIHGFYMTSPKFKLRNNFSWVSTFMRSYNSLIFVFLQICSSKLTNERVLIRFEIEDA